MSKFCVLEFVHFIKNDTYYEIINTLIWEIISNVFYYI